MRTAARYCLWASSQEPTWREAVSSTACTSMLTENPSLILTLDAAPAHCGLVQIHRHESCIFVDKKCKAPRSFIHRAHV